jgi:hypothetical protein
MAPAFDSSLMFRTTGTLTQDESLGPIVVYGGQAKGLAARVVVPQGYGANDTVLPKIYTSNDGSTYNLVATYPKGAQKPGATGLELIVPIPLFRGKNYVKLELDVTVASTTPNFGTVVAGIVENPGQDWDRSTLTAFH